MTVAPIPLSDVVRRTPPRRPTRRFEPIAGPLRFILFLIYGIPILWIVLTSLKSPREVITSQASLFFTPTVDAYVAALADSGLFFAFTQSMLIASGTTALTLLIAVPAGYGLARVDGRVTTVALGVLIVLQMLPQTASVIPLFQIFGSWQILDQTSTVILANTAHLIPFAIILLRPFFRSVPEALQEAAAIDGASAFRTFFSVMLPVARNGVATTGTLVFLMSWGEFLYSVNFFLSPGRYPLSALLAQQVSAFGIDWPGLMALAVITSVPILILFTFTYRLLREGLTLGAVK